MARSSSGTTDPLDATTTAVNEPLVAVVVVNWNGLADTRDCVRSLLAQSYPRRRIYVVDNGSEAGQADALAAEFGQDIELRRSPDNLGFTGGNNLAIEEILRRGDASYVALLNNDAVAERQWLEALVRTAEADPRRGIVASRMVFFDHPDVVENTGVVLLTSGEAMPRDRGKPARAVRHADPPIGACAGAALYRVEMLREIGLFRTEFFANFEDVDLSLRALACGWDVAYAPEAVVRHRLGRSIRKVRGTDFLMRSQRNLLHAYWVNLPWPVLVLNLPSKAIGLLATLALAPLFGQRLLARVVLRSRLGLLREWSRISAQRRALASLRRGSWWTIWRRQSWFLPFYLRSFLEVAVLRRRRFFE